MLDKSIINTMNNAVRKAQMNAEIIKNTGDKFQEAANKLGLVIVAIQNLSTTVANTLNQIISSFNPLVLILQQIQILFEQLLINSLLIISNTIETLLIPLIKNLIATIQLLVETAVLQLGTSIILGLIPALEQLWLWVSQNVNPILEQLSILFLTKVVPVLGIAAATIAQQVVPVIQNLFIWISQNLIPIIKEVSSIILKTLNKALGNASGTIDNVINKVILLINKIRELESQTTRDILGILQAAFLMLKGIILAVIVGIDLLLTRIETLPEKFGKSVEECFRSWGESIDKFFWGLPSWFGDLVEGGLNFIGDINPFDSGGYGNMMNTSSNLALTTNINVHNTGSSINHAEIIRWGNVITDIVDENLGRRF